MLLLRQLMMLRTGGGGGGVRLKIRWHSSYLTFTHLILIACDADHLQLSNV